MNQSDLYNQHAESDFLDRVRKLYPNLTDEQLAEAQRNLDRYIEGVLFDHFLRALHGTIPAL